MMNGWGGWGGVFWMTLGWAAIVGVIYLVVRSRSAPEGTAPRERDAMDILDERFARGEISEEEYAGRRRALEGARR